MECVMEKQSKPLNVTVELHNICLANATWSCYEMICFANLNTKLVAHTDIKGWMFQTYFLTIYYYSCNFLFTEGLTQSPK